MVLFIGILSLKAKFLFVTFYKTNDYTCNSRIYKSTLIKEICKNKNSFL